MMNFCTLFDSYYIVKGLALYDSLCKTCGDNFTLYISAGDRDSYNRLISLNLKNAVIEYFDEIETPELLAVKPTRTKAEYCWTYGPTVIYHFIQKYNLPDITYLDADLYFMSNPKVVYDEIGDNSIAITEHFIDDSRNAGKYCVQYMFFRNDEEGLAALTWWRDRCIEWCFYRYEDGKFGDQKYLEQFPIRYKKVCVIENRGVGIAPWNMSIYDYKKNDVIFENRQYKIVFFHFHGITTDLVNSKLTLKLTDLKIGKEEIVDVFINPYLLAIKAVYENYLDLRVDTLQLVRLSKWAILWKNIKYIFRNNSIAKFIYYNVLDKRYKGLEKKKV